MSLLLLLTSAMLAVSGAVKLRSAARRGSGLSLLALGEMLVAVALAWLALPGVSGAPFTRWAVPGAVLLLLGSSAHHGLRLGAYRRRRAESEGGRLVNYVRYISGTGGGSRGSDDGGHIGP
jgi:drug/metabolite transporter superfamily protein YnfA